MKVRKMVIEDYNEVYSLWLSIKGFAIRSIDDSLEGITRFINRNPNTSIVAIEDDKIVGTILCGHDGRRGCFYHVCVHEDYRERGIGTKMVEEARNALKEEGISKITLIAFTKNEIGNAFWRDLDWVKADYANYYEHILNEQDNVLSESLVCKVMR